MMDQVSQELVVSVKKDLSMMFSGYVQICFLLNSAYGQSCIVPKLFSIILHVLSSKKTVLHLRYLVKEIVEIIANDIQLELPQVRLDELLSELIKLTGLQTEDTLVDLKDTIHTPDEVEDDDEKLLNFYKTMYFHLGEKGGSLRMFSYTFHKWILQILMTIIRETRQPAFVSFKTEFEHKPDWENVNPLQLKNEAKMEKGNDEQMENDEKQEDEEEETGVQEQEKEQDNEDAKQVVKEFGTGKGNWNIRTHLTDEHKQKVREIVLPNIGNYVGCPNTIRNKAFALRSQLGLNREYEIAMRHELRRLLTEQTKKDRAKTRRSARNQTKPNYLVQ